MCIHRLTGHPELWNLTEVHIYKIKDKETGGAPTPLGEPFRFDYNNGTGFTIGGVNPLKLKQLTLRKKYTFDDIETILGYTSWNDKRKIDTLLEIDVVCMLI